MRNGHANEIGNLIEPGRVHRRVYTDPDVFELEMERIFGRAWLFVGHASQVPNPGDYITTELGRQPVVMTRHRDGSVHVLLNRCTHRGAKVRQRALRPRAAPDLLLSRLDLRHRRHADRRCRCPEGCAADFRQGGLRSRPRAAHRRIPRLRVREPRRRRSELRGPYRPDQGQHRRPRRPRARRRARLRRRHAPLRLRRQLEAPGRERAQLLPRAVRPRLDRQQGRRAVRPPRGRQNGAKVVETDQKTDRAILERPQELHRRQRPRLDQQHRARRRQALEPGLRCLQAGAGRTRSAPRARRNPHAAAAQLADLSQHVDHGA